MKMLPLCGVLIGCVSSGEYDSVVEDAARAKAQLQHDRTLESTRTAVNKRTIAALRAEVLRAEAQNQRSLC